MSDHVAEAIQDHYPEEFAHCYGCGRLNAHGLRLRSGWDGEETVAWFTPRPQQIAVPGFVYGGLLASLIDCHAMGTAAAAAERAAGRAIGERPAPRFVTAALRVDYLEPTPLGPELEIRGRVREMGERKVVVETTVAAAGRVTARGEVVAVRMPEAMARGAEVPAARRPSGRPGEGEFAAYAREDIDRVAGDDAVAILIAQRDEVLALLAGLDEARVRGLTYAPGKWTLKQVIGHLTDDERIFAYRALCLARGDERPLPGFDEKAYMRLAGFEERTLGDLATDYAVVRQASVALFAGLDEQAWRRRGLVNDYPATVRGLAFHIAGHELRHLRALREKYLAGASGTAPAAETPPGRPA